MKKVISLLIAIACLAAMFIIPASAAQYTETAELIAILAIKPTDDSAAHTNYKYVFKTGEDPQAWIDSGKNSYEMWWGVGPKGEKTGDCSKCHAGWETPSTWAVENGYAVMTTTAFDPQEMNAGEEYALAKNGGMIGYACELTGIQYPNLTPEKDGVIVNACATHTCGIKANCDIVSTQFHPEDAMVFDGVVLRVMTEEEFNAPKPVDPPQTGDTLLAVAAVVVAAAAGVVLSKKH